MSKLTKTIRAVQQENLRDALVIGEKGERPGIGRPARAATVVHQLGRSPIQRRLVDLALPRVGVHLTVRTDLRVAKRSQIKEGIDGPNREQQQARQ